MKALFLALFGFLGAFLNPCHSQVEHGVASYYKDSWKGRRTASGESFHPDSLTCAHRTQPFGTQLLVSCPSKGTSVIVRVNDRGPFGKGRIVDLSSAAAKKLGIILAGIAPVEVQVYQPEMIAPLFPAPVVPDPILRRDVVAITNLSPVAIRTQLVLHSPPGSPPQANPSTRPKAKSAKKSHSATRR